MNLNKIEHFWKKIHEKLKNASNCTHDELGSSDAGQSEHIYDNRYKYYEERKWLENF